MRKRAEKWIGAVQFYLMTKREKKAGEIMTDLLDENKHLEERIQAAEQAIGALIVSNVIEAAKDMVCKRMDEVFAAQESEIARYKWALERICSDPDVITERCCAKVAAAALAGEVEG